MKLFIPFTALIIFTILLEGSNVMSNIPVSNGYESESTIKLPPPKTDGNTSVEKALFNRRSYREYKTEHLNIEEISQLLWAAQGITGEGLLRTAPSAGALYALNLYLAAGEVKGIPEGFYKYDPFKHELHKISAEDIRAKISEAALSQSCLSSGKAFIVITGIYERISKKYGERGIRYTHIEVGHAVQNIYLQSVPLNIGTVIVGAFRDEEIQKVLNLPAEEIPFAIMPLGKIKCK
jgi:SagB-type dehydrogenase family enzyme